MTAAAATPARKVAASLVIALGADSALQTILGATVSIPKVYLGRAPESTPLAYIVIGDTPSEAIGTFDGRLARGEYRIHLWATDGDGALELYENAQRILDRQILPLDGFVMLAANLSLVTSFADPTPSSGHQAVANYRWSAQLAA